MYCLIGKVGELEISGSSLTSGYYKRPDVTESAFSDGWFSSGDLAYLVDGELVLCGRIKDLIVIGGRNIYPQDIEWVLNDVEGVRKGNTIVFGITGKSTKEKVVVVAETKLTDNFSELISNIKRNCFNVCWSSG